MLAEEFPDVLQGHIERGCIVHSGRLERVVEAVPRLLGRKFKYSQVDREERSYALRQALDLLCKARLCHKVPACDGTGVPLAAGIRERVFKVIFLDVGMVSAALGLSMQRMRSLREVFLVNEGALAEQAVGQALRKLPLGIRFSPHSPSLTEVDTRTTTGLSSNYRLLSLPLYMAGQIHQILDTL